MGHIGEQESATEPSEPGRAATSQVRWHGRPLTRARSAADDGSTRHGGGISLAAVLGTLLNVEKKER